MVEERISSLTNQRGDTNAVVEMGTATLPPGGTAAAR